MRKYLIIFSASLFLGMGIVYLTRSSQHLSFSYTPDKPVITKIPVTIPTVTVSQAPTVTPKPTPPELLLRAPFAAQAPRGQWQDPRFQDGCEETSALIAVSYFRKQAVSPDIIEKTIIDAAQFQEDKYGSYHDTSAQDTADRIFKEFFNYQNVEVRGVSSADEIISLLGEGKLVVIPANGRKLHNPFYTAPGPERHMLVVIGYDFKNSEFITQDPGTRHGEKFRYSKSMLFGAIQDYPTGNHVPNTSADKRMIVVY